VRPPTGAKSLIDELVTRLRRQFSLHVHDETLAKKLNGFVTGDVVLGDLGHRLLETLSRREDVALMFACHGQCEKKRSKLI